MVEVDSLSDLPLVLLPIVEPELESDEYLESVIVEDLEMVQMDDIEVWTIDF